MSGIDWPPPGGGVWCEWYGAFKSRRGAEQHLRHVGRGTWEARLREEDGRWEVRWPVFSS